MYGEESCLEALTFPSSPASRVYENIIDRYRRHTPNPAQTIPIMRECLMRDAIPLVFLYQKTKTEDLVNFTFMR